MFEGRVQGVIEELLSDPKAKREDWLVVFHPVRLLRAFRRPKTVPPGEEVEQIRVMIEPDEGSALHRPSTRRP